MCSTLNYTTKKKLIFFYYYSRAMSTRKPVAPPTIELPSGDGDEASPSSKRQKVLPTVSDKDTKPNHILNCKIILARIQFGTLSNDVVPKLNHLLQSKVIDVKEGQEVYSMLHNILWILACLLKKKGDKDLVATLNLFSREDRTTKYVNTLTLPKPHFNGVEDVIKRLQSNMNQYSVEQLLQEYDVIASAMQSLHPHT